MKLTDQETREVIREFFSDDFTRNLSDDELRQTILTVITLISGYMSPKEDKDLEGMLNDTMSFIVRFLCVVFEAEKRGNSRSDTVDQLNKLFDL